MTKIVITLALLFCLSSSATAQVVIGDCNTIVNLRFDDDKAVADFFGDRSNIRLWAERIRQVVQCAPWLPDPVTQLRALVVSLAALISLKEDVLLPALDRYINDPSDSRRQTVFQLANLTTTQVESTLIDTLRMAARARVDPGNLANAGTQEQGKLAAMTSLLQDRLSLKLSGPLAELERMKLNQTLNELRAVRYEYGSILAEMKKMLVELQSSIPKK